MFEGVKESWRRLFANAEILKRCDSVDEYLDHPDRNWTIKDAMRTFPFLPLINIGCAIFNVVRGAVVMVSGVAVWGVYDVVKHFDESGVNRRNAGIDAAFFGAQQIIQAAVKVTDDILSPVAIPYYAARNALLYGDINRQFKRFDSKDSAIFDSKQIYDLWDRAVSGRNHDSDVLRWAENFIIIAIGHVRRIDLFGNSVHTDTEVTAVPLPPELRSSLPSPAQDANSIPQAVVEIVSVSAPAAVLKAVVIPAAAGIWNFMSQPVDRVVENAKGVLVPPSVVDLSSAPAQPLIPLSGFRNLGYHLNQDIRVVPAENVTTPPPSSEPSQELRRAETPVSAQQVAGNRVTPTLTRP